MDGRTHWEGCWREHLECAVARIEEYKRITEGAGHDSYCDVHAYIHATQWIGPEPKCDCWKSELPKD